MTPGAPHQPSLRNAAIAAALLAVLFCLFLLVASHTPRGRLNVMQVAAVLFFLLVIARSWMSSASSAAARPVALRGYGGMWLAVALGACVWAFSFPVGFINDDFGLLYGARQTGWEHFWQFVQSQNGVFFRPLGYASIFLDYRMWGQWVWGYHLTNIVLHLASIAGLYCLCGELGLGAETATAAASIYAVLPVHAEAIAWIGCRFGLLSDALIVGAAVLYLRSRDAASKNGGIVAYGGATLCFVLAALSKESAFVFPLLLLVIEFFFVARRSLRRVLGLFLVAAVMFAGRWAMMGGIGGYGVSGTGRPATFDIGFKTFEGLLLRAPAVMLFGYNWFQPPLGLVSLLAALAGGMLLVLAWCARKANLARGPVILSIAWMGLAIAPAHPLLMIGADLTNSRNLHPGTVGLALLLGYLITQSVPTHRRRMLLICLVALLGLASVNNLAAWRWTSQLTQRVLSDVQRLEPAPAPNTEFVVYGMPETVRGVFLLHEGLAEALRISYGRDDVSARHAMGPVADAGTAGRPVIRLEWNGEAEPVLRRLQDSAVRN